MRISGINTVNIYFGQNNKNRQIREFIPSGKSALLCSALLASSAFYVPGEPMQAEDELKLPASVAEANAYRLKHPLPKEKEEFRWETIPDYKKVLWLFYSMVAIIFLMHVTSGGSSKSPQNTNN